jgi:hypothetical protein
MKTKEEKARERRIDRAFAKTSSGIVINILDIPKVFREGQKAIAEGVDDAELEKRMRAFLESIRVDPATGRAVAS